ncbi:MHS family MFS transporter [Marinobacter sp. 71-i]|uniref:MHS family MFS transporter n=1 Tax=Marinobacter iranensis TaxID=2962607 RepID=A0ABT5YAW1_9GAMM|nr:MFS transporter [Marinobacter iranensis]MDF0750824.1 MHS family MFS transporter [Marinobacter iranensis]
MKTNVQSMDSTSDVAERDNGNARRGAGAAFVGTVLEYYDLFIYGTAAALVFGKLFFSNTTSPKVALILSFGAFASGYVARPLGAVLFGHIGDRFGRRAALLGTIWLMGSATFLIGLLPTYAVAGALAPVLLVLLRLCQGLAIGGELGGAVLVSVEHAPENKRGFYGSFSTAGGPAGGLLATVVFALVTQLPQEQFEAWGWRIPFLLSVVILIVGLMIRSRLDETPDFEKGAAPKTKRKLPIQLAIKNHWQTIFGLGCMLFGLLASWYIVTVYGLSYAVGTLGMDKSFYLWVVSAASLLVVLMNPVWGALSDRLGRRRLLTASLVTLGLLMIVFIAALNSRSMPLISISMLGFAGIGYAAVNGIWPAFLVSCLPPEVRYTAGSLGIQLAGIVTGFVPLAAVVLADTIFGIWGIGVLCLGACLIGAFATYVMHRPPASAGYQSRAVSSPD